MFSRTVYRILKLPCLYRYTVRISSSLRSALHHPALAHLQGRVRARVAAACTICTKTERVRRAVAYVIYYYRTRLAVVGRTRRYRQFRRFSRRSRDKTAVGRRRDTPCRNPHGELHVYSFITRMAFRVWAKITKPNIGIHAT